jgi:hypothetical protein
LSPAATACLLAACLLGLVPAANAAPAGPTVLNPGKSPGSHVVQIGKRGRAGPIYVPIAPSYRYYDYPYYYSRGYYPIHIRPGFIYYGYPYSHYIRRYRSAYGGGGCSRGHLRCVVKRGHARDSGSLHRRAHHRSVACRCR